MRRLILILSNLVVLVAILSTVGCATTGNVVEKSDKELATMEMRATKARGYFSNGEYGKAEKVFKNLAIERTVNQPLYQCELGMIYLAKGDSKNAYKQLRAAQVALESLYDDDSEKKAASLWGSEKQKVYKGEPYERSSLYLILGLCMLDRGQVDNALACFKSGLLCDADVEKERYKSDFGLLYFLAAKCCDLRQEDDMQAEYMKKAFYSFLKTHPEAGAAVMAVQDLQNLPEGQDIAEIKRRLENAYGQETLAVTSRNSLEAYLTKKIRETIDPNYYRSLKTDFNTLIVVHAGGAPRFVRAGRYGEERLVKKGQMPAPDFSLCLQDGRYNDALRGFGSLAYQATTRGGRVMDNRLEDQAEFKGTTEDVGKSLVDNADDVGGYVGLAMLGVGLVSQGVSAATTVEADIRTWGTLPNEFQVIPMELPPGDYAAKLYAYRHVTPVSTYPVSFTVDNSHAVNVVHVFANYIPENVLEKQMGFDEQSKLFYMSSLYTNPDKDNDGLITKNERSNAIKSLERSPAIKSLIAHFDRNQDGKLDEYESSRIDTMCRIKFVQRMVQ